MSKRFLAKVHNDRKFVFRNSIYIGTSEKRSFCHSLEEGNPGFKAKNIL